MNPTPAKPGGTRIPSRRIVLRGAFTAAVVTGTAGALLPLLDHERAAAPGPHRRPRRPHPAPDPAPDPRRKSSPRCTGAGRSGERRPSWSPCGAPDDDRVRVAAEPGSEIRIDGRPLHVMRRADGTYLSDVRHYESYPTLLETARAAVDELGAAGLAHPAAHRM